MSLFIGKCFACGRLFQASDKDNVGTLTIAGNTYRVEICYAHREQLEREVADARRTLGMGAQR